MSANQGISPINLASDIGKFRILLGDTDPTPLDPPVAGQGRYRYFSDSEVQAWLDLYPGSIKRAAVRALLAIAGSEVLKLKSWTSDDLAVRGDLITESLRKLAGQIQADIDAEDAAIPEDEALEFSFFAENPCVCRPEAAPYVVCRCW